MSNAATALLFAVLMVPTAAVADTGCITPNTHCSGDACSVAEIFCSNDPCYQNGDPGFNVYLFDHDSSRRITTLIMRHGNWGGGSANVPLYPPIEGNPNTGPTSPVTVVGRPGCTQYFENTAGNPKYWVYTYELMAATFIPGGGTVPGSDCPNLPIAIPNAPPFPSGAPTVKSVFRLRSPLTINHSRVWLEKLDGNVKLADDGDVPGKHFTFTPDLNGHTYIIAANDGFLMYAGDDSGGGKLDGLFAGQIRPANCGFRIAKAYWVLEPVPAKSGFFFIRNAATGDHLQVDWNFPSFGDQPTLINPRGNIPEQWELIP